MALALHGPERFRGQGLSKHQSESADRAIAALLGDPEVRDQVDLVMTFRQGGEGAPREGHYEAWSRRGRVRFRRYVGESGLTFVVDEIVGENPLANQDPHALRSVAEEKAAAQASGFDAEDPARRFIRPEYQSYPYAYERIAQLFDSPNAPDLAISPLDWCSGLQPGTHGALHIRQARAPLWFAGRGIRRGDFTLAARAVDIAPTALAALGFPRIDGADASGRSASQRGVEADTLLKRQDGRVVEEILDGRNPAPRYLYLLLLDGLHHTELEERLASDPDSLPNLGWLRERAAVFTSGSIVNFPSITWPSHTTIGTGTWCGHHDVVNPSYYLRDERKMISPQGQQIETEGFSNPEVESIYEAFARVRGSECLTAAIFAPFGRGADHAVLERRNLCDREHLHALNADFIKDQDPRWQQEGCKDAIQESTLDTRGVAQAYDLFRREDLRSPDFVYHELILTDGVGHDYGPHSDGMRSALEEGDRRIGRILSLLEEVGRLDETLFVLTADHGMAPQDTGLAANPARHVKAAGLQAEVADHMIWLLDSALELERAPDGRTGRIQVGHHDPLPSGERPPIADAEVRVEIRGADPSQAEEIARGRTDAGGIFGFPTPVDIPSGEIVLVVCAPGCNERQITLDGGRVGPDPCEALYGEGFPGQ
jgi:hypothetical protein